MEPSIALDQETGYQKQNMFKKYYQTVAATLPRTRSSAVALIYSAAFIRMATSSAAMAVRPGSAA